MKTSIPILLTLTVLIACSPVPTLTPDSPPALSPVPATMIPATALPTPTAEPTATAHAASTPTATSFPTAVSSPLPTRTLTPRPSPTVTPTEPADKRYKSSFGIDYGQPAQYVTQGDQTRVSDPSVFGVLVQQVQAAAPGGEITRLGYIYRWVRNNFGRALDGGKSIGAVTTDELLASRRMGGCHDWALVYASIARELGYPAVLVDTASIAWMKEYQTGKKGAYVGHVFVEVYAAGRWMLVDATNSWYVDRNYDPENAIIPLQGGIAGGNNETYGFYVMRKGLDTWSYGIRSAAELNKLMEQTASQVKNENLAYPLYTFGRFW